MSQGINYLHSHSGLERNLHFPKHIVLVDTKYADLFSGLPKLEKFKHDKVEYIKVPTMEFYLKGGRFKNLEA